MKGDAYTMENIKNIIIVKAELAFSYFLNEKGFKLMDAISGWRLNN